LRVAWIGPAPTEGHGAAYVATHVLRGLAREVGELDCYVATSEDELPETLRAEPGIRFFCDPSGWKWGRWYSRTALTSFATGQLARAVAQARLASLAARRHAEQPYDLLYQFSQIELGWVRRLRRRLPPIVLHPGVHAAGELRWHQLERELALRGESRPRHMAVRAMLKLRSRAQRRDMRLARSVIAISRRFAEHMGRDYGLPMDRFQVVPNPIDLDRFRPPPPGSSADGPLTILYLSRIAVRKGVEMVVALSHRLSDLSGQVRILVVGERTLWSDYTPLLDDLNEEVATYYGDATAEVPDLYRSAAFLIQPSHYEPFALTVAEALASGVPVVASDEVGAVEGVDPRVCRVFPAGDLDEFESTVREMVATLAEARGRELGELARAEAERLFAPDVVASELARCLERAAR
jgi:glycosyltransferase involved in cell wall biosynthesis